MGNLDAKRDWGYAVDYVEAMWKMLQQPKPSDLVIATGESHTVRELLEVAFNCVGLRYENYVRVDPALIRPAEVDYLCGDATRARQELGWKPQVSFARLIEMMVEEDLRRNQRHPAPYSVAGAF